ncbi:purine nucleotide binding protein [Ephemerocybe angulata]|uniref:Replication factor C subunit 1 n=1 Tax=Ephemerocybe angulata TaxID=980116 RepID=A0A8H6LUV8_9AGAR|nr:purine nucleotide binding protein [Tulosesus angulatus]KAF6743561.1 purine nucleotide binding protein [Tulosesus angulatus]
MAPAAANVKKTGKSGDLRMFFGGGSAKTPTTSQKSGSSTQVARNSSQTTKVASSQKISPITISDDDDPPQVKPPKKALNALAISDSDDDLPLKPTKAKPKHVDAASSRKRKTNVIESDDDDITPPPKKQAVASKTTKPTPKASTSKPKKVVKDEDFDMASEASESHSEDEFVSSDDGERPKKAPKKKKLPPPKKPSAAEKETTKPPPKTQTWAAIHAAKLAKPQPARGTKEIPNGDPNALAGLAFVFTGELASLAREEAIDLAKRFGGRVVGQPSSKTDYVVLGDDAGPKKLEAIKKHKLKTLDEDAFLKLIGTRKVKESDLDEKTKKKMEKERQDMKKAVKEMEKREKAESSKPSAAGKVIDPKTQLWTTRYAPQSLKEVCGNKAAVEKLQQWLEDWQGSMKAGFKKPGKNMMNIYRAVLITGPPGIGKTTSAHLCAKLAGYTPIELNASDARSKKLVENGMNVNNSSLDGYMMGNKDTNSMGVPITDRTCLIMDEVDGMSSGDRGGVGALNALIKKSKVPIICIANDRNAQKLNPLKGTTFNLPFQKPQVQSIRSRIMTIVFKENLKIPANVVDQLITGAQSDIRQVLNMLSTWKLSNSTMNFDESKDIVKMNEKYQILSPFDITSKVLGPGLFAPTARETLGEKMEYYFQDFSFVPLFIQENYLKPTPSRLKNDSGVEKSLKELQLMDSAASSISDGDLVDALIHGPEQHWSLMPLHAVCSTIRPASAMYGTGAHYGGNPITFPQWLGQNSKQNKLMRQLGDVQIRMRLKVSGDKNEIRQSYIPAMFPHIVKPLIDHGADAVDEVIEHMDNYFLSKEEWDTIVELGVGPNQDEMILKKIPTAAKSSFTRKYNAGDHPIPFHKATDLGKAPKKLAAGPAPDIEDAFEADNEVPDEVDDDKSKEDPEDVTKDSLIKMSKKKKSPAAGAGKGKAKAAPKASKKS